LLLTALEEGKIGSLDDQVSEWEPRLAALNAGLGYKDRALTWRHLANQVSGYGVREKPGEAFDYSDYQTALFWDTLRERVYGLTQEQVRRDLLRPLLTVPLQFQDQPALIGRRNLAGRLRISPRDLARFGYLYLRGGVWRGRRLISREHVRAAVSTPLPAGLPRTEGRPAEMIPGQRSLGAGRNQGRHLGGYSFMWWVNGRDREGERFWGAAPPDTFAALGHGGRTALIVVPSLDLVACWVEGFPQQQPEGVSSDGRPVLNEALRRLVAAVQPRLSFVEGGGKRPPGAGAAGPREAARPPRFGPARLLDPEGHLPHCATDAEGLLHVAFSSREGLVYLQVGGPGEVLLREVLPGSKGAFCPWISVTRQGEVLVAWDRWSRAFLSVRTGGRWSDPLPLPRTYENRNYFVQVTGGGPGEAYLSSWSMKKHLHSDNLFHRVTLDPESGLEAELLLADGGNFYRPPTLIGPVSGAPGDGRVHALPAGPLLGHALLGREGRRTPEEDLLLPPAGKLGEGAQGFFAGEDPGVVAAWTLGQDKQAFLATTLSRTRREKAGVSLGFGSGYPRAAYDPVTGALYVLYARDGTARLSRWQPSGDRAEELGDVPGAALSFGGWHFRERGAGAGGIAPRREGGVHLVYSSGGALYHRTLLPP